MKVEINKVYPFKSSVVEAWQQLKSIEKVAECMPGSEITEKVDENHFKGKVKVQLGPVVMAFNGEITVVDINNDEHKIHIIAKGKDNKGTSSANMDLTALIQKSETENSELVGDAVITVNGKLANFAGRMMTQVSDQILAQFAHNFSHKLMAGNSSEATVAVGSNEINGFKIAWHALIGFFKSFFKHKD